MVIRDVGRVLGLPYGLLIVFVKILWSIKPMSLQNVLTWTKATEINKRRQRVNRLVNLSLKLEGLNRNVATHAAGVVIAIKLTGQYHYIKIILQLTIAFNSLIFYGKCWS